MHNPSSFATLRKKSALFPHHFLESATHSDADFMRKSEERVHSFSKE